MSYCHTSLVCRERDSEELKAAGGGSPSSYRYLYRGTSRLYRGAYITGGWISSQCSVGEAKKSQLQYSAWALVGFWPKYRDKFCQGIRGAGSNSKDDLRLSYFPSVTLSHFVPVSPVKTV
jgi:hypothetical protein